jgi:hypothetical protein
LDVAGTVACTNLDASGAASCSNLIVADRIDAEDLRVVSDTGFTSIIINGSSDTGSAQLALKASGVEVNFSANNTGCRLQTQTEHPI